MKKFALALIALLGFGISAVQAGDERCHDVYSHSKGDIVMTASARGGPSGAQRVYAASHNWSLDEASGLWHTKLCATKAKWAEWNMQYRSAGMSMCVTLIGQPDHCKGFQSEDHEALTCASQQYFYNARR